MEVHVIARRLRCESDQLQLKKAALNNSGASKRLTFWPRV